MPKRYVKNFFLCLNVNVKLCYVIKWNCDDDDHNDDDEYANKYVNGLCKKILQILRFIL